ncbi:type II toxin-antitoxin system ParD family antitoxin [Parasphingorhabdus flavimaris]|uniref:type II toxin-antitoxin system ParD family antitoxin n=1 Tax=Parasphingorhabdus flavimaris TaxID=266812 RepID=UPI003003942C
MPTRNINLTDHFDQFLANQLDSGRFKNASEVVRAGLSLLERAETEDAIKLEALRKVSALGLAAYEKGEFTRIEGDGALDRFFEELP